MYRVLQKLGEVNKTLVESNRDFQISTTIHIMLYSVNFSHNITKVEGP